MTEWDDDELEPVIGVKAGSKVTKVTPPEVAGQRSSQARAGLDLAVLQSWAGGDQGRGDCQVTN